MRRRTLLRLATAGAAGLAGVGLVAARDRWTTRRVLIRAGLVPRPTNLLRNADFATSTTPAGPDYWQLSFGGPVRNPDRLIRIEPGGPVPQARALRLENPGSPFSFGLASFNPALDYCIAGGQTQTLSLYLKGDRKARVGLTLGTIEEKLLDVGPEWHRHEATWTVPDTAERCEADVAVYIRLLDPGAVYLAAPQLELGSRATAFNRSLMDDRPMPAWSWAPAEVRRLDPQEVPEAATARRWLNPGHRCLRLENADWMPLGIMVWRPDELTEEWQWQEIATQGFNTVVVFVATPGEPPAPSALERTRRWLDTAARHGLRTVVGIMFRSEQDAAGCTRTAVEWIRLLRDHPSVAAWWVADEPERWWDRSRGRTESELKVLYAAAREADLSRPVFINHGKWTAGYGGYGGLEATDIGCGDRYPAGLYRNPVQAVADFCAPLGLDCFAAGKPAGFWLQLIGGSGSIAREPTVDELRAMAFVAFIRGSRLLFYWAYRPTGAALWQELPALNRELKRLFSNVTGPDARWVEVGTLSRRAHYAVWDLGERLCVAVCNADTSPVTGILDLRRHHLGSDTKMSAWYDAGLAELRDGYLRLRLPGQGRQVLEIGGRSSAGTTLLSE